MSFPLRLNLTSVQIRQLQSAATQQTDVDFERPRSGNQYGAVLTLRAQVVYDTFERLRRSRSGDVATAMGRLVFRKDYLERQGVTLQKGDRVVGVLDQGVTFRTVSFRVIEVAPSGHLPNPGIVVAFFEHDREERSTP